MIKPQSCATQTFFTVTSPFDLSTSTSAVTATTEFERALMATPRPVAILPLDADAGAVHALGGGKLIHERFAGEHAGQIARRAQRRSTQGRRIGLHPGNGGRDNAL